MEYHLDRPRELEQIAVSRLTYGNSSAAHDMSPIGLFEKTIPLTVRSLTIFVVVAMVGCAGLRDNSQPFTNKTSMSDSAFQTTASADWKAAQQALSTQAINLSAGSFGVHDVLPDPRALTVQPSGIVVRSVPDAPGHPGIIQCGSITGYCYAYLDNEHTIIVPDSKPTNMGPYEMETIILWELGYDVSGR